MSIKVKKTAKCRRISLITAVFMTLTGVSAAAAPAAIPDQTEAAEETQIVSTEGGSSEPEQPKDKMERSSSETAVGISEGEVYAEKTPETSAPNPGDAAEDVNASVSYQTHIQSIGWQTYVKDGALSGTEGQAKRLEAVRIKLDPSISGSVEYRTHIQNIGWQSWVKDGALSGTEGQAKRLEAIMIRLTGTAADQFDIYYRVHVQNYGWLDWAKNGDMAGTQGQAKRLEALEICLVKKGEAAPGMAEHASVNASVGYQTHVQTYGWQEAVKDRQTAGTEGQAKRLEAIRIELDPSIADSVEYQTHIQSIGWQNWVKDGRLSGTEGQAKRLEAIKIRLTGTTANRFDIYYRVHVQSYGWLDWAKNGEPAGTEGQAKRMESIQICLVNKGSAAPGNTQKPFVGKAAEETVKEPAIPVVDTATAISGFGTGGVYVDIRNAPYTTFAGYSYGQYAYGPYGCAWYASARVKELTGVGSAIWSGSSWWNGGAGRYGFSAGRTIRAHALACYSGHVLVVEKIEGNTVTVSEGGYGSGSAHGYTGIRQTTAAGVEAGRSGYGSFLGYVYLD